MHAVTLQGGTSEGIAGEGTVMAREEDKGAERCNT